MTRFIAITIALTLISCPMCAGATTSQDPPIPEPGELRAAAAGGVVRNHRDLTWTVDAAFEIGIAPALELAGPLALGIRIIDGGPGSGLILGIGVVDMCLTKDLQFIYSPALVLAGQVRIGPESSWRASLDITGAEKGFKTDHHPAWLRGAVALVLDIGPWVTLAGGLSYQRQILSGESPAALTQTGWAGGARISLGSVRAQPFSDLPLLSIHATRFMDIVCLIRFDVDTDTNTSDTRWLLGLAISTGERAGSDTKDPVITTARSHR